MSPSSMAKTRAYADGVCDADGGPNLRSNYSGEMLEAYDYGYNTQTAAMAEAQAEADHPLTILAQEANVIAGRSGNPDVRELAWLVERLANALKESN